ncbi:hypothetical protein GF323_01865 [Candidatus Woesearchaeota archaeon]|nr:hypothetical protein [Candidatus Woesearchaeota archaeon]
MAIGKKGAFFTIIGIIMFTSLAVYYINTNKYSPAEQNKVILTRVKTMDSFIADMEHDIERGIYISSMRSMIGISQFMVENGSFINKSFEAAFNEIMLNATVSGQQVNLTINQSFKNWTEKIANIGSKLGINVEFHGLHLKPYHISPWKVKVILTGKANLTDDKGLASWDRDINISTEITIIDFEDPLYTVISEGKYSNQIIRTKVPYFSSSKIGYLKNHTNHSWYIASARAPSFLMRFEKNLSASPHGIESLVNIPEFELATQDIPQVHKPATNTIVDFIYFNETAVSGCIVNGTNTTWIRLETVSLPIYDAVCGP